MILVLMLNFKLLEKCIPFHSFATQHLKPQCTVFDQSNLTTGNYILTNHNIKNEALFDTYSQLLKQLEKSNDMQLIDH